MNSSKLNCRRSSPTVKPLVGSDSSPHDKAPAKRERRRIGDALGLKKLRRQSDAAAAGRSSQRGGMLAGRVRVCREGEVVLGSDVASRSARGRYFRGTGTGTI
jgi:hypothetical protein